jgi:hypothetical protein
MRQFWANQFDFNDRNDFPRATATTPATRGRPGTLADEFAFGDVRATGSSMADLGGYMAQVTDGAGLPRFAISVVQQLCYYANSAPCSETDTEFRRVVGAFKDSPFNFAVLAKEFFASPLVTGAAATGTYAAGEVPISIARRDHLCAALSNRPGPSPTCVCSWPRCPAARKRTTASIAASVASDAFSRGAQAPVTPSEPTMFYRARPRCCARTSRRRSSTRDGGGLLSSDIPGAINAMVENGDGLPGQPPAARAGGADLMDHQAAARRAASGSSSSKGNRRLRVGVRARVRSPAALGIGL